jgi:hypothetical protein
MQPSLMQWQLAGSAAALPAIVAISISYGVGCHPPATSFVFLLSAIAKGRAVLAHPSSAHCVHADVARVAVMHPLQCSHGDGGLGVKKV